VDAIVEAGRTRLRPIMITSVSTVLGLLPMAIGVGEGAEIRRPMAITVIGGIAVATFLTLVVIPVLYAALDRKIFKRAVADEVVQAGASPLGSAAVLP
jgi:HAE1 family hydrophobic/amphiphilic exporter-1